MAAALVAAGALVAPGRLGPIASAATRWGPDYFPNVPLVTQDGKTVRFYDDLLKDKIVAVDLIYTSCEQECPMETARLAQVQKLLGDRVGKDIYFYSLSIDPKNDTPAVLQAYARKYGAGPGWTFLTGKAEDIKLVAKKLGLVIDAGMNKDGHGTDLMIGNVATGEWMRNSALDNPKLLAMTMTRFMDGWKRREPVKSYAEATPVPVTSKGQYLFATKCAACHTVGQGDRVGPDLKGVTHLRDRAWLARYIATPNQLRAQGDPIARALSEKYQKRTMPNLGLGPQDVAEILGYLDAPAAAAARPQSTTTAALEKK